jgi:hypothetical protein
MINTLLVLVFLSVYTFEVSKTTFEDKDMVSMRIRARNACRRNICWLHCRPDRRTQGVATRPKPQP